MKSIMLALLLAALACFAQADEVFLINGDRLTGNIEKATEDNITVKTELAGEIILKRESIRHIRSDDPQRLLAWNLPVGENNAVLAVTPAKPVLAARGQDPVRPARWQGDVRFNLGLLNNAVNTQNLSLLLNLNRITEDNSFVVNSAFLNSRQGGVTTEESFRLNADYNYGLKKRLYGYFNGAARTDRIQQLNLRTILGAGAGYIWTDSPSTGFRTEAGLSFLNEDFVTSDRARLAGQLGYKLRQVLFGNATFLHDLSFLPNITDFADNYLVANFSLQKPIAGSIYFDISYLIDYTSRPAVSAQYSTSKLLFTVGKKF